MSPEAPSSTQKTFSPEPHDPDRHPTTYIVRGEGGVNGPTLRECRVWPNGDRTVVEIKLGKISLERPEQE